MIQTGNWQRTDVPYVWHNGYDLWTYEDESACFYEVFKSKAEAVEALDKYVEELHAKNI